jgi:acetyl-CoA C-acetyltransferase
VPEAYVLETLRTARTKASPRGGFAGISPVDLLTGLQRELVTRTGLDPGRVEDVIIGCASQNAEQGANIARTATMLADWGDVPGVTINRFCDPATVRAVGSVFMSLSADLVATIEGNERNELDAYGLETQIKAARAWDEGFFDRSLESLAAVSGAAGLGVAILVERVAS